MRIVKFTLKFLTGLMAGLILVGACVGALAIWYFGRDLPDYQQLTDYQPPIVSRVYAGDGRLLAEYATEKRVFVPVKEMPPLLIHAFLAAEDKNFYTHSGIDPLAMLRAGVTDVMRIATRRRPVGASTITQQVAKNFLVGSELSYQRKIKEALVALRMEKVLGKDRILELYLNEIYLGGGTYGVAAAALNYFNKSLDELSIDQVAFLAALPKGPNNYNPQRYPEAAKGRRDWVIGQMLEAGFITSEQAAAAQAVPITLRHRDDTEVVTASYFTEEVRRDLLAHYGEKALYQSGLAVRTSLDPKLQTIADRALRDGLVNYDRRHGWRGAVAHIDPAGDWRPRFATVAPPGGTVEAGWSLAVTLAVNPDSFSIGLADGSRGTIPLDEMRWARKSLPGGELGPVPRQPGEVLHAGDVVLVQPLAAAAAKAANPPLYTLRQVPEVSGAVVALDPHTGRVLALSGGFSYELSQFDRATQAHRQIGSAIKPFVYLTAMDHGFTPSSVLLDEPFVVDQGVGLPKWKPSNYTHKFYGPLTLRVAVEQSRNLITARLGEAVGLDPIGETIERFGIMDHMPRQYAQVLGAGETTPLKLTTAYAMLDNGGKRITPTLIDRIQDRNGVTIYRADQRPCEGCQNSQWQNQAEPDLPDNREQIADPASAYQIVSILQGVVERGTGRIVSSVGKPLAGKTGTTNDSDDTWFVGFSPDLAFGVFVGYDNPKSLGAHETGASVAAPVFRDFMAAALKDKPAIPFRIPPGIRLVRVDATTGQLPRPGDKNVIYEAFKPGTEPTSDAPVPAVVRGPISDDEDAASLGGPADETPENGTPITAASPTVPTSAPRSVPASGTGGLY
ncbi:MAG TPA: penicillin-binding protein 1A [Stellaceae bacterium]|nr:penicillin-binding protein 1A [Stellaceae bacterium]